MKERYKSKDDINNQIQRIYKNHSKHRLYDLAQGLVLLYNYNMSMTKENTYLHSEFMEERDETKRQELLDLMGTTKYPKSVYAKINP